MLVFRAYDACCRIQQTVVRSGLRGNLLTLDPMPPSKLSMEEANINPGTAPTRFVISQNQRRDCSK